METWERYGANPKLQKVPLLECQWDTQKEHEVLVWSTKIGKRAYMPRNESDP